jgi:hypothetical protein
LYQLTIGAPDTNTLNVNLREVFKAQTGILSLDPFRVEFTVAGNIGSVDVNLPTIDTGSWPDGSTITLIVPPISDNTSSPLNGIVAGKGGTGRTGIKTDPGVNYGGAGGTAVKLNYNLNIINYGIIGGGGGGGGAGYITNSTWIYGAGGGGGAGISIGTGGPVGNFGGIGRNSSHRYGGEGSSYKVNTGSSYPGNATYPGGTYPGFVYVYDVYSPVYGGDSLYGASGGNLGQSGNSTTTSFGGAAGKAIDLNGYNANVTVMNEGVIHGISS